MRFYSTTLGAHLGDTRSLHLKPRYYNINRRLSADNLFSRNSLCFPVSAIGKMTNNICYDFWGVCGGLTCWHSGFMGITLYGSRPRRLKTCSTNQLQFIRFSSEQDSLKIDAEWSYSVRRYGYSDSKFAPAAGFKQEDLSSSSAPRLGQGLAVQID